MEATPAVAAEGRCAGGLPRRLARSEGSRCLVFGGAVPGTRLLLCAVGGANRGSRSLWRCRAKCRRLVRSAIVRGAVHRTVGRRCKAASVLPGSCVAGVRCVPGRGLRGRCVLTFLRGLAPRGGRRLLLPARCGRGGGCLTVPGGRLLWRGLLPARRCRSCAVEDLGLVAVAATQDCGLVSLAESEDLGAVLVWRGPLVDHRLWGCALRIRRCRLLGGGGPGWSRGRLVATS
ncbi:hypothetical protein ACFPRL_30730 [Pseudoclavibacter helvolus]